MRQNINVMSHQQISDGIPDPILAQTYTMKLTAFLTVLSLSSFVAAAPIDKAARGLLPSPGALLEKAYPHSGIPQLAGKLDKLTGICMCYRPTRRHGLSLTIQNRR